MLLSELLHKSQGVLRTILPLCRMAEQERKYVVIPVLPYLTMADVVLRMATHSA